MATSPHSTPAQLQKIIDSIAKEAAALYGQGKVASYIPVLAQVAPRQFGMAIALVDGTCVSTGSAGTLFSIQSISKLFTFVLALKLVGDDVWQRVGREPSGAAFNSMVQLETEKGIPRNPFINAGALVITDMLTTRFAHLDAAGRIAPPDRQPRFKLGHANRQVRAGHGAPQYGDGLLYEKLRQLCEPTRAGAGQLLPPMRY
jgi:hypothetical protein